MDQVQQSKRKRPRVTKSSRQRKRLALKEKKILKSNLCYPYECVFHTSPSMPPMDQRTAPCSSSNPTASAVSPPQFKPTMKWHKPKRINFVRIKEIVCVKLDEKFLANLRSTREERQDVHYKYHKDNILWGHKEDMEVREDLEFFESFLQHNIQSFEAEWTCVNE